MSELNSLVTLYNIPQSNLEKQCNDELILNLTQEIPSFTDAVLCFGFTQPEIEELRVNYDTEKSRRLQMLFKWKSKNGSDATYLAIVKVFLLMGNRGLAEIVMRYVQGNETHVQGNETHVQGNETQPSSFTC